MLEGWGGERQHGAVSGTEELNPQLQWEASSSGPKWITKHITI
jgi:hypothetical protein